MLKLTFKNRPKIKMKQYKSTVIIHFRFSIYICLLLAISTSFACNFAGSLFLSLSSLSSLFLSAYVSKNTRKTKENAVEFRGQ